MSNTTTSPQAQLDEATRAMNTADQLADALAAKAAAMTRVADQLGAEVDSLHNLFLPIRNLHTTATWEGNAATQSRQRLDVNEERFGSAVQMINGLIGQLGGAARTASSQARSAREDQERHRRTAANARSEVQAANNAAEAANAPVVTPPAIPATPAPPANRNHNFH